jgi:hypothetical protein
LGFGCGLAFVVAGARPAASCTCRPLDVPHFEDEVRGATLVFVGRVKDVQPIPGTERSRVTLEVTRRWRGPEAPTYTVTAGPQSPADLCLARFERGETYLAWAFGDHVGSCRLWKRGGPPPFAAVGSILDMPTVIEQLDRLMKPGPGKQGPAESGATPEGPRLFGIASLVVAGDHVEVTQDPTLPSGLELQTQAAAGSRATVKVGESFDVTDRHHFGYTYKLLGIQKGVATIEMTIWTAFLGAEPTQSTTTIGVRSYVTRQ